MPAPHASSVVRDGARTVVLPTTPEPLEIDLVETALIVVDMQHAYLSKGGYLDLVGFDVSGSAPVIEAVRKTIGAARKAGVQIVYLQNGFDPELKEAGPASSPVYHKSNPLKFMRANPSHRGRLITKGAWDFGIVEELAPQPSDIVVTKARYSGFAGTNLEMVLRARAIRNLVVVGVNTNVCVESTIRDAYHREFFAVMVKDATLQAGDPSIFEATVFNVERFLGWVTTTDAVCGALAGAPAVPGR
ncbi:cysteine hydrolase [Rhodoplanes sp. TEM]|uniref:Cysteine hydrolase n=1 Tax=Rhodoplanes tepidamans TaxID=200616 RepID=A0ABT5J881_RHOTP|nr:MULTISPECIES: isochorismatase family cysteine hydrolase [Rhodoplanes]MDC7785601.1 cysteine hydrolase [Rhodoplanes tepidamans]MDC7985702.1 cysteine hydrolase [Rhodoplanes sp. TEM]MDQ0354833.1 ureidoacrylate peracid hydrolase [Rhodoplanes tepidamans]